MTPGINTPSYSLLASWLLSGAVTIPVLYRMFAKRRSLLGYIFSGLGGAFAGAAIPTVYRALQGVPYKNTQFNTANLKPGDTVYFGFSGATDGLGSKFHKAMQKGVPADKLMMFRHGDSELALQAYKLLPQGVNVISVGNSWGGKTSAQFSKNKANVSNRLIDPVSRFDRLAKLGTRYIMPSRGNDWKYDPTNFIADLGGRWSIPKQQQLLYVGGHDKGILDAVRLALDDSKLSTK